MKSNKAAEIRIAQRQRESREKVGALTRRQGNVGHAPLHRQSGQSTGNAHAKHDQKSTHSLRREPALPGINKRAGGQRNAHADRCDDHVAAAEVPAAQAGRNQVAQPGKPRRIVHGDKKRGQRHDGHHDPDAQITETVKEA